MSDDLVRVAPPDIARPARAQRAELVLPAVIVDAGPAAVERFLEFFAARIANARTRAAYGRAVGQFLAWCAARGLGLTAVSPLHVAAYIRTHPGSAPTVKQHLAAIRMLDDYLAWAGLDAATAALFQSVDPAGRGLTGRALSRRLVLAMIKRRAAAADLPPSTCCHTFRATGITAYLSNGGTLEHAQQIAGHASPKTTKLYDRTADTITVDEIERIVI